MTNLYSILETNTVKTLNPKQSTEKIDILFDLEADRHTILDSEFDKNIIGGCGSCDLILKNNGQKEIVPLNNHSVTTHLNKNIRAELKNYTNDAKVFVEYLEKING